MFHHKCELWLSFYNDLMNAFTTGIYNILNYGSDGKSRDSNIENDFLIITSNLQFCREGKKSHSSWLSGPVWSKVDKTSQNLLKMDKAIKERPVCWTSRSQLYLLALWTWQILSPPYTPETRLELSPKICKWAMKLITG